MLSIEKLIGIASERDASDVHLIAGLPPKCRIDGRITDLYGEPLTPMDCEQYGESLAGEEIKKIRETGQLDFAAAVAGRRLRVNLFRQQGRLSAALRLLRDGIPKLSELGLPPAAGLFSKWNKGIVLVTGETGSGKSTTLAAILEEINATRPLHIITLEDPIEYLHRHNQSVVSQREIGLDTESYVTGLRAALRQAPDVILVGEMRDEETIKTALTAAETGHLVISTLHTVGAANTIDRIIDSFPPAQQEQVRAQLSMVMQAVVSQQLIPKVEGGVVPAFEVMFFNNAIRNLIRESKIHQIDNIIATSQEEGMISMDNSLIKLYRDGVISRENAIAYSSNSELMEKKLAR